MKYESTLNVIETGKGPERVAQLEREIPPLTRATGVAAGLTFASGLGPIWWWAMSDMSSKVGAAWAATFLFGLIVSMVLAFMLSDAIEEVEMINRLIEARRKTDEKAAKS